MRLLISFLFLFVFSLTNRADAQIVFDFTFDDVVNSTGVGFDDPVFGAERQNTIAAVGNYFNTVFNGSGEVDITIEASETDGAGPIASAGPFFTPIGGTGDFESGLGFDSVNDPVDFTGGPDGIASFDFGFNFNSGLDPVASNEFDLFTIALHEFSHVLGFLSVSDALGESAASVGVFTDLNSFLELGDGTPLFGADGNFLGTPNDLTSGDVFFNGPNANANNGGNPVPIFAPSEFSDGSSLSHVELPGDSVLNFSISSGTQIRELNAQELGIFADIGFDVDFDAVAVVPEPSSVCLIFGLSTLMVARRRRTRC